MGSLRNPIGPLPSSIYWRRRVVALSILAVLVLLVVWAFNFGGGGSEEAGHESGSGGRGPSDPITPGPSSSDSGDDKRPGGRDSVNAGADSGGGGYSAGDNGGSSEGGSSDGGSGGSADGGALGGSSGSVTGGGAMPAGSELPVCDSDSTEVKLTSAKNEYGPGDKPKFTLTVRNGSGEDCRIDLGRTATVLKISDSEDKEVWSSDDCPPSGGSAYVQVPADGESVQKLSWDRKENKPGCGNEPADPAGADTYLVEVSVRGLSAAQTSFVLTKD